MVKEAEGMIVHNVIDEFERHMDVVRAEMYLWRCETIRKVRFAKGWFRRLVGGVWQ